MNYSEFLTNVILENKEMVEESFERGDMKLIVQFINLFVLLIAEKAEDDDNNVILKISPTVSDEKAAVLNTLMDTAKRIVNEENIDFTPDKE